jgi:hypothetical protein
VKFTLHYQGDLHADAGSKEKHRLRETFNPQLAEFCTTEPLLAKIIRSSPNPFHAFHVAGGRIESPPDHHAMHVMAWVNGLDNYWFVPLVTRHNGLGCRVDIKFMRPGKPGSVISSGGDLDSRIKTLFDGLRMPHAATEAAGAESRVGRASEFFYCLLEDDSLITDMSIKTETLLLPQSRGQSEAKLDIGVTVHLITPTALNSDYR